MKKLKSVKVDNQLTQKEQIIEYLKQDNSYWLENDKWDLTKDFFIGKKIYNTRSINFKVFKHDNLRNEFKYYVLYNFKNKIFTMSGLRSKYTLFPRVAKFLNKYYSSLCSLFEVEDKNKLVKLFYLYLNEEGLKNKHLKTYKEYKYNSIYYNTISSVYEFIFDFYDHREETEKDVWNYKKIVGNNVSATLAIRNISFLNIPKFYRDSVKRYLKNFITKRSFSHCYNLVRNIGIFLNTFYDTDYTDGFLKDITRTDMEKFFHIHNMEYKDISKNAKSTRLYQIRNFLKHIQYSDYDIAPKTAIDFLIFDGDMIEREKPQDTIRRAKFIPETIMKQIDNNIMDLDNPELIPIYILLRETGWRGADVLNLRYNNCLEKVWNSKEEKYTYNLCGGITKTGIQELKIPIREEVAQMIEKCIEVSVKKSNSINNPRKYLFNTYRGHRMGLPVRRTLLVNPIRRLIKEKDIRNTNGKLHHFRLHSLRHTRAKEYVEQGIGISIVQQMLGHRSLQMTVHYAKVTENTLYQKWKDTEDLELFKINPETHEVKEIDLNSADNDTLIRYEYIRKNLDAVRVPFGVCFKPSKLPCKQQLNHCLTCASFCTTVDNIPEYEEEIERVKQQMSISERCGRKLWAEKNKFYLKLLLEMLEKVKEQKLVHKNAKSREVKSNG